MSNLVTRTFWLTLAVSLLIVVSTPAWSQTDQRQAVSTQAAPSAQTVPTPASPTSAVSTQVAPPQAAPTPASPTPAVSTQQSDSTKVTSTWTAPDPWFVYTVVIVVLLGSLLALRLIGRALSDSTWSLADALSEEVGITAFETIDGVRKPMMDASQKPLLITEMRASVSRVVALMGMIVIMLMFLGFGTFALYGFAKTGNMPGSIDKVVDFLVAGLTLFAPYVVNKFSTMFEGLSPKKS